MDRASSQDSLPSMASHSSFFDMNAIKAVNFLDTGRRSDVDLGQMSRRSHRYRRRSARVPPAPGLFVHKFRVRAPSVLFLCTAAGMKIGPGVAFDRDSRDATRWHTVNQDDALVALAYLRQIALDYECFAILMFEHLEQGAEVLVVRLPGETRRRRRCRTTA